MAAGCPTVALNCVLGEVASSAGTAAADVAGIVFAAQIRSGARWMVETTIGWWINVPSIDLETSPVHSVQSLVWFLALSVAVGGVMWQGARMALSRKPGPLIEIGRGLFSLVFWSVAGVALVALALTTSAPEITSLAPFRKVPLLTVVVPP